MEEWVEDKMLMRWEASFSDASHKTHMKEKKT